jgi:hypothetical protein
MWAFRRPHRTFQDDAPCPGQGLASFDRHRHDARMRLPWNKSTSLQLDLLDAAAIADEMSPQSNATSTAAGQPLMLALTSLYADPNNPRTEIPEAELDELTNDIRERGVLQPIVVSAPNEDGRYRIQFGSRRWRAAMQAGLDEVPVMLATRAHDAYDQVAENLPPRQNSCRLHRSTSGAAMKDGLGSIRTDIQGQSGGAVGAAGERSDRLDCA